MNPGDGFYCCITAETVNQVALVCRGVEDLPGKLDASIVDVLTLAIGGTYGIG